MYSTFLSMKCTDLLTQGLEILLSVWSRVHWVWYSGVQMYYLGTATIYLCL